MIKNLSIKNFVLIDNLEISFDKGLNILTGETGAGKSIIIDAIDLAFGARSSKEQIKTGTNKAIIELQLELSDSFPIKFLENNGIEPEDNNYLIISREISLSGTRSRINGVLVTQNYVQELRKYLIDIHSQHETYNYIQPKTHIHLLDNYGDKKHQELLNSFKSVFTEYKNCQKTLEIARNNAHANEQKIDFLRYQIEEIDSAKIEDIYEYNKLVEEREVLLHSEELKDLTYSGYSTLYSQEDSVIDVLSQLENKLIKASEVDKNISRIAEIVSTSSISLKDAASELRSYSENLETDPEQLLYIEERIDKLDKLKRKYGPELSDVLESLEKFRTELGEIDINNERIEQLSAELAILQEKIIQLATELSGSRKKLAEELSDLIQQELIKLEMPKVRFMVQVLRQADLTSNGLDDVEFLISSNQGESLKPLAKIASGGEISRVMLAIKTIFAKSDQVNTVIFDEIDTGISGKTSQAVAESLTSLGVSHQILCITHQPIIAAMADSYFYIEKIQDEKSTKVQVKKLNQEEQIQAVSKLASGSIDDSDSINFATKLIKQSESFKKKVLC